MIFLPKYLREGDRTLDAFLPLGTLESEEGFGIALSDWRELKKIACDDQLRDVYVEPYTTTSRQVEMYLHAAKRPLRTLP